MWLWLGSIANSNENEDENYIDIIHDWWCSTIDENLIFLQLLMWFIQHIVAFCSIWITTIYHSCIFTYVSG
jgi:hypothetical protein